MQGIEKSQRGAEINMRNLILIHLESLNEMNYRLNRHIFPRLTGWEKRSLCFRNYFSTATSTWMVIADMMYGGMLQYEGNGSLGDVPQKYHYGESLLDSLKGRGYVTRTLVYENGGGDFEKGNERHLVGFQNKMELVRGYQYYMGEIARTVNKGGPFALLLCNFFSNVAFNRSLPCFKSKSGLDRVEAGYGFIDTWAGQIMELLEREGVLENTTVIFYGDHGDDYYEHGRHSGLTHAVEPYANLIRTPLWIYDGRISGQETYDGLVNTTDIRAMAESLLRMPEGCGKWRSAMPGRKYSLARNSYAGQPVRSGSFNKGYSLTDGRFLFLVSNHGMEMYDIRIDMQCQNNLLDFFVLRDGILYRDEESPRLAYHFTGLMDMGSLRQIRQNFYYFRKRTYLEAGELFCHAGCGEDMGQLNFGEIHYL